MFVFLHIEYGLRRMSQGCKAGELSKSRYAGLRPREAAPRGCVIQLDMVTRPRDNQAFTVVSDNGRDTQNPCTHKALQPRTLALAFDSLDNGLPGDSNLP